MGSFAMVTALMLCSPEQSPKVLLADIDTDNNQASILGVEISGKKFLLPGKSFFAFPEDLELINTVRDKMSRYVDIS